MTIEHSSHNEGQGQETKRPEGVAERVVLTSFNAPVMVVGLQHGTSGDEFSQHATLAKHLEAFKKTGVRIETIIADSFPYLDDSLASVATGQEVAKPEWFKAVVRQSVKEPGCSLVGADPLHYDDKPTTRVGQFILEEEQPLSTQLRQHYGAVLESMRNTDPSLGEIRTKREIANAVSLGGGGVGVFIGLSLMAGLAKEVAKVKNGQRASPDDPWTRRNFGKLMGLGFLGLMAVGSQSKLALELWKRKLTEEELAIVLPQLSMDAFAEKNDLITEQSLMGTIHEGRAHINAAKKLSLVWRNAMIADVVDQAPSTLNPNYMGNWNKFGVFIPMGVDHLIMTSGTIPWFITHPRERRATVLGGIQALEQYARGDPKVAGYLNVFIEQTRNGTEGYQIMPNGSFTTWPIKYPSLM